MAVFDVPAALRMPDARPATAHGRHVSLESLFPGTGLADAWHSNGALRTDLRRALRSDLFSPPAQWSAAQKKAATDLGSACMVAWGPAARGEAACDAFTAAFVAHGVDLDGASFIRKLGGLCGETAQGSLIDIIPLRRRVAHSWHQDSGLPSRRTVLLGFPASDGYEGGGVFSHQVKLSHALRPTAGEAHGAVVEYERFEPPPPPVPEECVWRPLYSRGREVFVSDDTTHLHSTPDVQLREALWRFM